MFLLLPPANEVCEGYVFTGVCLSRGECLGRYSPGQIPPGRYTPCLSGRYPPGQVPSPSRYPLGRYPLRPQCMLGYGQQAGSTHPTGMHSCLKCNSLYFFRSLVAPFNAIGRLVYKFNVCITSNHRKTGVKGV